MIMKQLYRKIVTIFTLTGLLTTSCDIINVTDVDPVYQVSEDKVITNIDQAQTVLYGVYGSLVKRIRLYSIYALCNVTNGHYNETRNLGRRFRKCIFHK